MNKPTTSSESETPQKERPTESPQITEALAGIYLLAFAAEA